MLLRLKRDVRDGAVGRRGEEEAYGRRDLLRGQRSIFSRVCREIRVPVETGPGHIRMDGGYADSVFADLVEETGREGGQSGLGCSVCAAVRAAFFLRSQMKY